MNLNTYLSKLENDLPEVCSTQHLVESGLFGSEQTVRRLKKKGLPYIQIGGRTKFLRSDVLEWLKNHYHTPIYKDNYD